MLKTFDVVLDVEKELHHFSMPAFTISQNDLDSVEITFHINQDESAFDLTNKIVQMAVKKPSGLTVFQNCEIIDAANGETRIILTNQAYIEYGIYTGELMISDADQMIVTGAFYYGVRTAILTDETIKSTNDWSALENALLNMDKKPLLVEGVPTETPEYIGQMAFDTLGQRAFIANELSNTGWQLLAAGEGGAGGGIVYWNDVLGKPLTFEPAAHGHTIAEIVDLQAALDSKADIGEVGGGAPAEHTHEIIEVIGLQAALDGKADNADLATYAPVNHVHDFADIANKPTTYEPAAHTHTLTDVTGLQAALDSKANDTDLAGKADLTHTHTTANITDFAAGVAAAIPEEYLTEAEGAAAYQPKGTYLTTVPPEYLTQTEGDARYAIKGEGGTGVAAAWGDIAGTLANQTDLQAALDAKADLGAAPVAHSHTIAEVTGLQAELDSKLETLPAHSHTVANITDFAAGVAANIPAEYLTEAEGAAAYQPKGTYLTTIPTEYLTETEGDARYMAVGAAPVAHTHTIADVTGLQVELDSKLETLPAHSHTVAEVTGLQAALDSKAEDVDLAAKADLDHMHTAAEITDFAAGVAANIPAAYLTQTEGDALYMAAGAEPAAHTHAWADITGEPTTLAGYGITDGASDQDLLDHANWQNSEIARLETDIAGKANTTHSHTIAEVTGLQAELDSKLETLPAHSHTVANITDFAAGVAANIPTEFLTETEGNALYAKTANVYSKTAVDTALAGKANTTHTHTIANITDFAAGVAANIPAAYVTDTEAAAAYQPKGTYLSAVPLASAAQVGGGRVGNGLGMTGEYLHVKTGAGLGINTTNYALQVQTVNTTPAPLNFWTGTAAEYGALTKDPNTLYFVTG